MAALLTTGCGASSADKLEIQRGHDYQVSVYSDGKEVKDFKTALVQRLILSPQAIAALSRNQRPLPVAGKQERDNRGQTSGVRISAGDNPRGLAMFGFRERDLLTAVGARRAESIDDLRSIVSVLTREKVASVTLERNGKPHKILYYLSESNGSNS